MINKIDLIKYPELYDIDWFLVSQDEKLMHFSSAGGIIPKIVIDNYDLLEVLYSFFANKNKISLFNLNPFLGILKKFYTNRDYFNYTSHYSEWAAKGFYTFDKLIDNSTNHTKYHLVAYPQIALQISSLPNDIQQILLDFQVDFSTKDFDLFNVELSDFLDMSNH